MKMKKNTIKKTFAQKIRRGDKTILYEFLPPPKNLSSQDIDKSISLFATILSKFPVDAINLPEVREETRNGIRISPALAKMEPRLVCPFLQKYGMWDLIINRPIVYLPWEKQQLWLKETCRKYNVQNYVFVGGESSKIAYPGLSVNDAAAWVKGQFQEEFPNICLGGIIIPTRKHEILRVLQKTQSGITFFTTQILFEDWFIKQFLKQLWEECVKKHIKPPMVFLSFAPIATPKDVELLRWLGVNVPEKTIKKLATGWIGMGWNSIQVCKKILSDILRFVKENGICIPLGLNVEHVSIHNLELSFILVEELSNIYLNQPRRKII
ncbi:MAG: hypothetical protein HYT83_01955 [Candidatus Levybacteria bacterium]|nr:hypothetical protein [Candidatus Levybacteria bacterium]